MKYLSLALLLCGTLHAGFLTIDLASPTSTGVTGELLPFFGNLTNATSANLFLNADNFNVVGFDASAIDDSPFFTNTPLFLGPAASTGHIGLFNIVIPTTVSPGSYSAIFEVLGGTTSDDQTIIGQASFTVIVKATSAVPEPASGLLLSVPFAFLVLALYSRYRQRWFYTCLIYSKCPSPSEKNMISRHCYGYALCKISDQRNRL